MFPHESCAVWRRGTLGSGGRGADGPGWAAGSASVAGSVLEALLYSVAVGDRAAVCTAPRDLPELESAGAARTLSRDVL